MPNSRRISLDEKQIPDNIHQPFAPYPEDVNYKSYRKYAPRHFTRLSTLPTRAYKHMPYSRVNALGKYQLSKIQDGTELARKGTWGRRDICLLALAQELRTEWIIFGDLKAIEYVGRQFAKGLRYGMVSALAKKFGVSRQTIYNWNSTYKRLHLELLRVKGLVAMTAKEVDGLLAGWAKSKARKAKQRFNRMVQQFKDELNGFDTSMFPVWEPDGEKRWSD